MMKQRRFARRESYWKDRHKMETTFTPGNREDKTHCTKMVIGSKYRRINRLRTKENPFHVGLRSSLVVKSGAMSEMEILH